MAMVNQFLTTQIALISLHSAKIDGKQSIVNLLLFDSALLRIVV